MFRLYFLISFLLLSKLGLAQETRSESPALFDYHTLLKLEKNQGQFPEAIRFQSRVPGGFLYVYDQQLTFLFYDKDKMGELQGHNHANHEAHELTEEERQLNCHLLNIKFNGSSPDSRISSGSPYPESINYLKGKDPSKWVSNAHRYQEITYHDLYDHIDLHIFKRGPTLKYEFIVNRGGNPDDIELEYEGADALELIRGNLHVRTSLGEYFEKAPYTYEITKSGRREIKSSFQKEGNIIRFKITGNHKSRNKLIIDPALIFSSYSGSDADNWGNTACVDLDRNLITGGTVFGTDAGTFGALEPTGFPVIPAGAFQTSFQGGDTDIGILKFDSAGTSILFATYLGGSDGEIPTSTITDHNNDLYILATTSSTDFPVSTGAYDTTYNGGIAICGFAACELVGGYSFNNGTDIAVIKLSSDGTTLLASTYVGGTLNDGFVNKSQTLCNNYGDQLRGDINVDTAGNVYVASTTHSANFPTVSAFQPVYGGGTSDACAFKLSPDLSTMIWSTFLGGTGEDVGFSIQRDSLDNAVVSGGTTSDTFPTTSGTLNPSSLGGADGYVSIIDANGSSLIASTRVGTSQFDQSYFVQLDGNDEIYLFGQTKGTYAVTPGTFSTPVGGQFIHKLNKTLDTTRFSTIFGTGTTPNISPTAFLVNECENIFISGWGGTVNAGYNNGTTAGLPLTSNAYQSTTDGSDFYLMALRKDADSLIYATYFGGSASNEHVDGGTSRFDKQGIVYQSVCAGCWSGTEGRNFGTTYPDSEGFPISSSSVAAPTNNSGNCNNGVFKFDLANLQAIIQKPPGCLPLTVTFQNQSVGGTDFLWKFGDGNDTTTLTAVPVTHTYDTTGTYTVTLVARDITTCVGVDSSSFTLTVNGQPPNEKFEDTTCVNTAVQLGAGTNDTLGVNTYLWFPTTFLNNPNIKNPISTPTTDIQYIVTITDSIGCEQIDTVEVTVDDIIVDADFTILGNCAGPPLVRFENLTTGFPPLSFLWNFGDGNTSNEQDPEHRYETTDTFTVTLTASNASCSASGNFVVNTEKTSTPNVITPNDDGINDTYVIENIEGTGDWRFEVFNRWGKRVFRDDSYNQNWDGQNLRPGTYYYLITSPDGNICKGWVELLR